jgi:hypothetical protein
VEVEAGHLQGLDVQGFVQGIQPHEDAPMQALIDATRSVALPKLGKAFVAERPDHDHPM